MNGLKRYIRPGLAVSVIGHLALLIAGLFFVSANAFHAPRPEAMVVEVVTPDEMPRFEGTPSNLRSSGSETPSPANGKGPVTQAPPPQPRRSRSNNRNSVQTRRGRPRRPRRRARRHRKRRRPSWSAPRRPSPKSRINRPSSKLLHHHRRNRHWNNRTSPKRSHNTLAAADRSAAVLPRRRSTPTCLG